MKYLKKFLENLNECELQELQEFCDNSLVYLIDDGFVIDFFGKVNDDFHLIILNKQKNVFNWNDIKDYYIPFLKLLSRYELDSYDNPTLSLKVLFSQNKVANETPVRYLTLDQVINDEIENVNLWGIAVKVSSKIKR